MDNNAGSPWPVPSYCPAISFFVFSGMKQFRKLICSKWQSYMSNNWSKHSVIRARLWKEKENRVHTRCVALDTNPIRKERLDNTTMLKTWGVVDAHLTLKWYLIKTKPIEPILSVEKYNTIDSLCCFSSFISGYHWQKRQEDNGMYFITRPVLKI